MPRLILMLGFITVIASARPALGQPVIVTYDNVPKREFGVSASAWCWSLSGGEAGSVGGRYTRNLSDNFAIEAGFDVGGMGGRAFALPSVQLRLRNPNRQPRAGFYTIGLATSLADRDLAWVPRGRVLTIGGGAQSAGSGSLAMRFDLQGMMDEQGRIGIRVMLGIIGGRD